MSAHLELGLGVVRRHHVLGDVLHDRLQVGLVVGRVVLLCGRLRQDPRRLTAPLKRRITADDPPGRQTHPRQLVQQQLGQTQRGGGDLGGPVVNHVVVEEGQLHQVLGQRVALYVRLRQTEL